VALICSDLNEYNQCQTQLKELYTRLKLKLKLDETVGADVGVCEQKGKSTKYKKKNSKTNKTTTAATTMTTTAATTMTTTAIKTHTSTSPSPDTHMPISEESEFVAYRTLYYVYLQYNQTSALSSSDLSHVLSSLSSTDNIRR